MSSGKADDSKNVKKSIPDIFWNNIIELLKDVRCIVYICDAETDRLIYVAGDIDFITGCTFSELMSGEVSWKELMSQEDIRLLHEKKQEAKTNPGSSFQITYTVNRKGKSPIMVNDTVMGIYDSENKPLAAMGMIWDLEERSIVEDTLKSIIDSSGDAIFVVNVSEDNAFRYEYVNPKHQIGTGFTNEGIKGKSPADILSPEYAAEIEKHYMECIRTKSPVSYEETLPVKTGIKSFETMLVPISDKNGGVVRIYGFARSIDERKKLEHENRMYEQRLESLLRIAQYDGDSFQNFLDFALQEAIELTGSKIGYIYFYDEEKKEFTLNTWSKEVMKECKVRDPQTIYQLDKTGIWGEVVRQRKPICVNDFEKPNPLKKGYPKGHVKMKKFLSIPVIIDRKIVAVVGVGNKEEDYTDNDMRQLELLMDSVWQISEKKKSEAALLKAKNDLSELHKMALISRWEYDLEDGTFQYTDEMLTIFEIDPENLNSKLKLAELMEYVHPDDKDAFVSAFEKIINGGSGVDVELRFMLKRANYIYIYIKGSAVKDEKGRTVKIAGSVQNITKIKETEERNRNLQEQLYQSQKLEALGQLAGGVAHDFNNMLAGIIGNAEILQMKIGEYEEFSKIIEKIIVASEHASNLTKQLLSFSRKGKYQIVPVNINEVVKDVISIMKSTMDKRIIVHEILDDSSPVTMGDISQIENAILNIAINARDSMPDGGTMTLQTEVKSPDRVCIRVTDTGTGMTDDVKQHLYEPFFTTKEDGKGTGLGLAGVYGIVKNHNGNIEIESTQGEGTVVEIYLPISHAESIQTNKTAGIKEKLRFGNLMVVDDEPVIRDATSEILRKSGFTVFAFEDPLEAIEFFKRNHKTVDAIILDMVMPKMNGREVYYSMKKISPDLHVIISSGFSNEGDARDLVKYENVVFLQKPYRINTLIEKIDELLNKK